MNSLAIFKDKIFDIKSKVEGRDPSLFAHYVVQNDCLIGQNTISIVMTASNRSVQTHFTLATIAQSCYKNVQVIIVDDSTDDPIRKESLFAYPFHIDLIQINRSNKSWTNPLVNYNIGFQFVQGSAVVIQNAEVCHVGDVLSVINTRCIIDGEYYVFDVKACENWYSNEEVYKNKTGVLTVDIYGQEELFSSWYQNDRQSPNNFHFLTAMTRSTFDHIGGFSYDLTMGYGYDDDDFVLKIKAKDILFVNMFHTNIGVGGIHLWHPFSTNGNSEPGDVLFNVKKRAYELTGEYVDIIGAGLELFNQEYQKLLKYVKLSNGVE